MEMQPVHLSDRITVDHYRYPDHKTREAHLQETLSLEVWAAVVKMPTPAFTRRFRAVTGCSPYAWFMHLRIDRAKEMLRFTPAPICDVALAVGFCFAARVTSRKRSAAAWAPRLVGGDRTKPPDGS
jgi:transcriptional regulator GlxA family with amidase domain